MKRTLFVPLVLLMSMSSVACDDDTGEPPPPTRDADAAPDTVGVDAADVGGDVTSETAEAGGQEGDASCGDGGRHDMNVDVDVDVADDAVESEVGAAACAIPCLAAITAACPAVGACSGTSAKPFRVHVCYENGVYVDLSGSYMNNVFVYKPGGGLCYAAMAEPQPQGSLSQLVWKDPAGATLLTGVHDRACGVVTVTCGDRTYSATDLAACPALRGLVGAESSGFDCHAPSMCQ